MRLEYSELDTKEKRYFLPYLKAVYVVIGSNGTYLLHNYGELAVVYTDESINKLNKYLESATIKEIAEHGTLYYFPTYRKSSKYGPNIIRFLLD